MCLPIQAHFTIIYFDQFDQDLPGASAVLTLLLYMRISRLHVVTHSEA
jgi:hypothetical protein